MPSWSAEKIVTRWLRCYIQNRKIPGSNPTGAWPGFGIQAPYEALGDLRAESNNK